MVSSEPSGHKAPPTKSLRLRSSILPQQFLWERLYAATKDAANGGPTLVFAESPRLMAGRTSAIE
jgi:hypothetical protein